MSVHTEDSKERELAKEIFEKNGAEDISYTARPQSLRIRELWIAVFR